MFGQGAEKAAAAGADQHSNIQQQHSAALFKA